MNKLKENDFLKTSEKPHFLGHRKRLKERFLTSLINNSSSSIPDYEILEIALFSAYPRQDVKPIAKDILSKVGSLAKLISLDANALEKQYGLSQSAVTTIKVMNEFFLRVLKEQTKEKPILQSWKALLDYCKIAMGNETREQFRILFLDKKNKLISDEVQQVGTVDQTPIYPREVVKRALEHGASAIILVHNHPSGDPTPSKADIEMTENVEGALNSVDIKLHDHLIIAGDSHFSFAGNGLI
ncbi:MAG: DNA repair protein RadC [Rickettsiales bacterium]|nr:DNA repair protein RadC [Rickettsiales bacterium]